VKILKSKKTVVVLIVAAAALLWAVNLYKDEAELSLLERIESRGSRVLGARLDVGDVTADWDGGRLSMSALVLANPGGFSSSDMVTVDRVEARADFAARVIETITLDGVAVLIEFRGGRSNFETLADRAARRTDETEAAGGGEVDPAAEDEAAPEEESGGLPARDDWRIETVEFGDARVRVQTDWTSDVIEQEVAGFTIEGLDAGTDDLARAVTVRFLDRILVSAADRVDNERLREILLEKSGELRAGLQPPEPPVED